MTLKYIVKEKDNSIKQILKNNFNMSDRLILKIKTNKRILINNISVPINYQIKENDLLEICIDFDEDNSNIVPSNNIPLNIVYEDDSMLIVDKPAGIPVHPSVLHYLDSLSNSVKNYFDNIKLNRKIRPVNRLDKDTSGLVIFAKNEYIQECLIKQMKTHTFEKKYIAILEGKLDKKSGTLDFPISRKENSIIERCVSKDGAQAITLFKVICQNNKYSKVEFDLKTGRTHQIRVHTSYIGHPIVGDTLYGNKTNIIGRQLLHAYKISFIHPITHKKFSCISPIPQLFDEIYNK